MKSGVKHSSEKAFWTTTDILEYGTEFHALLLQRVQRPGLFFKQCIQFYNVVMELFVLLASTSWLT